MEEEERHRPRSPAGDGHEVSSKDGPSARNAGSRTGQRGSRRLGAAGRGAREPAGRNGRDACWAVGGARDGTETWAPTSSGAAAAHLDDAGQAAIDQTLAASAIVEELGSMRPDRFSFSLRSGRCQWEKEDLPAGKRNRNGRDGPCHVELTKAAQHRAGWTIAPTWRRLPAGAHKPQQPSLSLEMVCIFKTARATCSFPEPRKPLRVETTPETGDFLTSCRPQRNQAQMSEISSLLAFLGENESFRTFGSPHSCTSSDEAWGGSRLLRGPGGGVMGCSRFAAGSSAA